ncbi:MAG: cell surface protein SprA [Bacteroidia bacterium]|nr:cell surface protein SprA [Bacteroidia bacterium]
MNKFSLYPKTPKKWLLWTFVLALSLPVFSNTGTARSRNGWQFFMALIAEEIAVIKNEIAENEKESKLHGKSQITQLSPNDSTRKSNSDSSNNDLIYPIKDNASSDKSDYKNNLDFNDPSVKTIIEYNPVTKMYEEYKEVAGKKTLQRTMTRDEYLEESGKEERKRYFDQRAKSNAGESGYNNKKSPTLISTPPILDKVFRGGLIDIQPSGSAELTFGGIFNTVRNPQFSARQQKTGQFDFDQKIQLNVNGKIGNALNLGIKYDTDATFDFDNQTKLNWVGKEDQMVKSVELGNVSLPLNGSLIQAGQSLFGIKLAVQTGKLTTTIIATQNKGQRTETTVNGGAQITNFNIQAHNYDQNRHYFLSQFFKDQFDDAMSTLPLLSTGVMINRVEVWVTNRSGNYENTRDVLTLMDLGEAKPYNNFVSKGTNLPYADNHANHLYDDIINSPVSDDLRQSKTSLDNMNIQFPNLKQGLDYELLTYARQLGENDFAINQRLGYISLNTALNNDEMLAVAFEYTYNGVVYKVGEFASEVASTRDDSKVLMLKMLKNNIIRTRLPMWELMMKNIYSLGSFNVNASDLVFNVIYNDDPSGADLNYMPVNNYPALSGGNPLIRVLNMDRINRQSESKPDGVFDALEDLTFISKNGRIIFPVREPFGNFLRSKFEGDSLVANKYVFDALYDSTKWLAEQDVAHNKFFLKGSYKGSSSNEISLNALNVPQGSVVVTANGTRLTENVDYIVDYNAGKVSIINQGILQSGAVIKVSAESNSMFNIQQKTLLGARFDYTANKKLMLGATVLHMYERALTPKTNIGDEPLLNTILGFDGSYSSPSLLLTKLVDKLPFIETKAESRLTAQGEYARIFPGMAKGQNNTRGVSYLDDFEGAETTFDLRLVSSWKLSSLPQNQPLLFPEWNSIATDKRSWGYYRSKLAWYNIDPTFYRKDKYTPEHIANDVEMQSNHFMREISVNEVFPNKSIPQGAPNILPTLDLAFYPRERGQYNYNATDDFTSDGFFKNPVQTWGGIMRRIESNDFEAANIDYIEIWMMDPFVYNPNGTNKGKLYIDLGNISEDILPDRRKVFENGFNPKGVIQDIDSSLYGRVPILPQLNNAFDNEPDSRQYQDLGLDGLNDNDERNYDTAYLNDLKLRFGVNSKIYQDALADPSTDNYMHNRDPQYSAELASIVSRYKDYNHLQGNSTLDKLDDGTPKSATTLPDNEDINNDFTMNQTEDYFTYEINLSPEDLEIGKGFVTDVSEVEKTLKNGKKEKIKWIQIKVPIREYTKAVGNISDFKSIRFMRVYMKGFTDSTILRFAQMQLVRADWRRYLNALTKPGAVVPLDPTDNTTFVVSTVNIEENGKRQPIRYVEPPGISRVRDPASQNFVQQNEQSLSLRVCNLKGGDSRAAYKTTNFDIRNYKNLKMFVHAEGSDLKDGEMSAFIRIGTDLVSNYYEYEIPLKITPDGTYDASKIWNSENDFDFELADLFNAKNLRSESNVQLTRPYFYFNSKGHKITVLGLPDLSNVRVIMLGVRNNTDNPKCGEVWFNELRVTDITNKGGWATTGRVVAQLADFATLSASGNISTIGFGGVDKRLNERNLSDNYQFDLSSSFELGKFFPQKAGVNIPMFIGYSGNIIRPKFNPLNPDVELKTAVERLPEDERKAVLKAAEDYNSRYSINFTNVRKNATGTGKIMPWSISNFNLTYSYIHLQKRNIQIQEQFMKTYHGSIGYVYSPQSKPWEPFKFIKSKHLRLIRDFNIKPLPQNILIRMDIDRYYSEFLARNNDLFKQITPRLYDKNFTMQRVYNVNYPITKSLKLDYSATVNSRIEEPFGALNTEAKKDSVRNGFFNFGKMRDFNQIANFNYTVPFDKVGILNWISTTVRYGANYGWMQAPPAYETLGNTIQNSREINVNSQFNMVNLYNKIPYLKRINSGTTKKKNPKSDAPKEEGNAATSKSKKEHQTFGTGLLRGIMMLRNVSVNYTERNGIMLPGFKQNIDYFGQNFTHNVPGLGFILGSQDDNVRYKLANNGSLSNDPRLNNFYTENSSKSITGNATVEPFKDFRIQLNFNLSRSSNMQSLFKYDTVGGYDNWRDVSIRETGMFSTTGIFINTAFENVSADNGWVSENYNNFENARFVISQRQALQDERVQIKAIDPITKKFYYGYGAKSQNTLIPAFLSAYTGVNQSKVSLSPFRNIPLPNWNLNYNGLSKMKKLSKIFTNITIQHRYSGTYVIGGYTSNLFYSEDSLAAPGRDLVSQFNINNVSIREQFNPLIGVDITTKSGITGGIKINRSRNVNLFVPNANLTEITSKEFNFNFGYRTSGIKLPIKVNGKRVNLNNDLLIDMVIGIANNFTVIRTVDQNTNTIANGQRVVSIRPNINYMINSNINLSIFYDRRATKPHSSNIYPTALTTFGIKLRYTIQ